MDIKGIYHAAAPIAIAMQKRSTRDAAKSGILLPKISLGFGQLREEDSYERSCAITHYAFDV